MCRDRAWRRYVEQRIVIRRLKTLSSISCWWRGWSDLNGINYQNPRWVNYLGTKDHFQSKTLTTPKWTTKRKIKYSPNKSKEYWRDNKKLDTREYRSREFFKILRENGIK